MTWTSARNAIRTAIAEALELPDFTGPDTVTTVQQVCWENQAEAQRWQTGLVVDLRLGAPQQLFKDERRSDLSGDPDDPETVLVYQSGGMREFNVTVMLSNDDQSEGNETVGELADKLRRRIRWEGVLEDLWAAGVAHVASGQVQNADGRDMDGRMVSRAVVDLRFRAVVSETDTSAAGYWIESAEASGVEGEDLEGADFDTAD